MFAEFAYRHRLLTKTVLTLVAMVLGIFLCFAIRKSYADSPAYSFDSNRKVLTIEVNGPRNAISITDSE